jgi:hypothetical protein
MTAQNSPFAVIAKYKAIKAVYDAQPVARAAKPRRHVRGTFGHGDSGTIPGLAPKLWNGADFTSKPRHGGAYSKAGPVLMPVKGHALQGGKVLPPRTVRGVPRGGKVVAA